ncbi:hypothetical protein [Litchfieldia salsa]|uniref:Uncharacterized protein n=1 Tax=Litchfieldia salsa TaxID=930152 RepID=A0A1H0WZW2_9BACI|nr:hypothetical protein [Litchfieldia salsa]SDP96243.1 hypothetical protein SAMN05216565_1213 [Litchfieldia salsa]
MNVELAFIKTEKIDNIIDNIKERLVSLPDTFGTQPDVGIPNSYDSILAIENNRKIAVSQVSKGWISIIESKEVNDYKLLLDLSVNIQTEVIGIVLSEVTGNYGYVEINAGKVMSLFHSEQEEIDEEVINNLLLDKQINIPIYMFREVASNKNLGWQIIKK